MKSNEIFDVDTTNMENLSLEEDFNLSWKEKYDLLERQMEQFRTRAATIREAFGKKMKEYEERITMAEKKKDETLDKIDKLMIACQDKDEAINALREKIARMRAERSSFLLLDDEKMLKIKEWVKVKFTELFRELERTRAERDMLVKKCETTKRNSDFSVSSNASHYYEEVFGELLDDLQDKTSSYESISSYLAKHNHLKKSFSVDSIDQPPDIPPRRASIREESRFFNANRPKPLTTCGSRKNSPTLARKLFNLPDARRFHGSFQSLDEEALKLSQDDQTNNRMQMQQSSFKEPMSPMYFTLQATVNGMEFENHQNSVPVYSTMEGMASCIREEPFSGETTDSDTEQRPDIPAQKTANNLPVKEANFVVPDKESSVPKKDLRGILSQSTSNLTNLTNDVAGKPPLRTCASFTEQNMREETLAKAGWLTKLGGRVKNWKRRWFTLMDGKLNYFKSRHDMYRKPLGWIAIKLVTRIKKSEQPLTFEVVTPERTYYLTADTKAELDDWIRVLKNSIKRFSGARLLSKAGQRTIYAGWVTKAKCGTSKHCWAVLKEKTILFYRTDVEQAPIGALSIREIVSVTHVKDDVSMAESDLTDEDNNSRLMIQCLKDTHPTYFVLSRRSEMELWLHHLQQMSSGDVNNETDFEQIVTKLMNVDGDGASRYWRNKLLIHSRNVLKESLTSLPTQELEKDAINLWKSIQLFSETPVNETAIDYHIALSQDIIQICLTYPELQTEIYCQLIKQTSKYRSKPGGSVSNLLMSNDWSVNPRDSSYGTVDQQPVSTFVYAQCWQLLALCTSIFLPKLKILWLLKAHLHRNANETSDVGRYAIYCQRSLDRMLQNGERETRPSRLEAMSLIARNPYFRIYPMSIPVYFINNTYQLFSFDGSTTVAEFSSRINEEVDFRDNSESGYSLFTDNPIANVEHCLQADLKISDVISKWEQAAKQLKQGRFEPTKAIKLTYKNRLFFPSIAKFMTEKEKLLHVFQINESLRIGHLITSHATLSKLTALLAQIEFGDYVDNFKLLEDIVQKIYPQYSYMKEKNAKMQIDKSVSDDWSKLKGRLLKECIASYISISQKIPFYGFKLFKGQEKLQQAGETSNNIWFAIGEEKIQILTTNMEVNYSYVWPQIITFGGYKEDFMLVVQPEQENENTIRHVFGMPPGRVLEVTLLIASYINAVVIRSGLGLETRGCPQSYVERGRIPERTDNHLWDMECQI